MSTQSPKGIDLYAPTYGQFHETLHTQVRRETWGEEFGPSGWITASEQDRFVDFLGLLAGQTLLDIGCGSGGSTLRLAAHTGIIAHGIDVHMDGIVAARRQTEERQLTDRVTFEVCDARDRLPFEEGSLMR